jgi:catechol 2,3-dioxygenase-like lactoylglutathione lyase family enzyme
MFNSMAGRASGGEQQSVSRYADRSLRISRPNTAEVIPNGASRAHFVRHSRRHGSRLPEERKVPVERLMMVTIQVRDFDAMVRWYQETLGLTVLGLEPNEFCLLKAPHGSSTIALATDHPERIPDRPGIGWTPTFAVDDFDQTIAELRARGVELDAPEEGADEGYRLVRIRDPEGNAVGLSAA